MADPAYQAAADQVGALQWLGLCWSQREGLGVRSGGAGEAARRCDIVRAAGRPSPPPAGGDGA